MGAEISYPEDDSLELTSEDVVGLVGESSFDQVLWAEAANKREVVTVRQLKDFVQSHHNFSEDREDVLFQESTGELEEENDSHTAAENRDEEGSADERTHTTSLQEESTRDIDDFTLPSVVSVSRVVEKLPAGEYEEKYHQLRKLYQAIHESRVGGVIPADMKENVIKLRQLLTMYYDQNGSFFISKNTREKILHFIAEYYHVVDHYPRGRDFMRFYSEYSQLKISGLNKYPDIRASKPIAVALLRMYHKIQVCHEILDIKIERRTDDDDNFWDLFVTVSSLVKLEKDAPKKVLEFFYLKERSEDEFRALYGQYYIKKQIVVDQGFRPLWCHAEILNIPQMDYINFDECLGKPQWLLDKEAAEQLEEQERLALAKAERKRLRKLKKRQEAGEVLEEEEDSDEDDDDDEDGEEIDEDGNVIKKKKKKVKDPEFVDLEPADDASQVSSVISSKIMKKRSIEGAENVNSAEEWGYEENPSAAFNNQEMEAANL